MYSEALYAHHTATLTDLAHLLLVQVLLVEEEDHGRVLEVAVVADLAEELDRLDHAVRGRVLKEALVVLGQRRDEDDRGHVVEAVDPLLALVALAADVVHLERGVVDLVALRHNAARAHTCIQDVLLTGQVAPAGRCGPSRQSRT